MVDFNLHRNDFSQHGLYLNTVGKGKVAEMIVENIKEFRVKKKYIPITSDKDRNQKDLWPELHATITHAEINKISMSDMYPMRIQNSSNN
jgi:hypothetical protein